MKVAFVYDRVNKFGGAERLLMALHRVYPEAPIFTLVHEPESAQWAKGISIVPTFLNKISFFRNKHEWLAPIAPLAFETLNLSGFDVIISVTSSDAKSVITKPNQLHVCYCLTPTRYFWSGQDSYSKDLKVKILPNFLHQYFRTVDLLTSKRPDEYIAISEEVKNRIRKFYSRDSDIIYPPIEEKFYSEKTPLLQDRDYYLVVSRLVPYKSVDLVIRAFNKLNKRLIIVGQGSELEHLKSLANSNISFTGQVSDSELIDYYRHAKAVIFPQEEDFGLVPLESQALGTPVIAFAKGGALETVIPGITGILFKDQTEESLIEAIEELEKTNLNPSDSIDNAKKFNFENFSKEFKKKIDYLWKKRQGI